jgi:hypothetical protein
VKIPEADRAVVDLQKLEGYCLNENHPRGKHKARVFRSALGLTKKDSEWLREQLFDAIQSLEAEEGRSDRFGQRFVLDFQLKTEKGKETIRSKWIIRREETFPRFVTCYVF